MAVMDMRRSGMGEERMTMFTDVTYGPHYNGNGQYKLRLPGEPKASGRTRMTTYIKAIDRADTLIPWSMVMAIQGYATDPALRARWSALTARTPNPYYDGGDTAKTEAKAIADAAKEAGGANQRRDIGTAVHDMCETVITGHAAIDTIDDTWRPLITNILAAIDGAGYDIVPELCELAVHNAIHDVVGRFDMTLRHRSSGEHVIADLKTGGVHWKPDLDYKTRQQRGWRDAHTDNDLVESMQLAGYAAAAAIIGWPANPDDECTVTKPPGWSQEYGIIIHAPSTGTEVTLRHLDLAVGRAGLDACRVLRDVKRLKPLLRREGPPAPPLPDGITVDPIIERFTRNLHTFNQLRALRGTSSTTSSGTVDDTPGLLDAVTMLVDRINAIRANPDAESTLMLRWPDDVPGPKKAATWTPEHVDLIAAVVITVERDYTMPFLPQPVPPVTSTADIATISNPPDRTPGIDEGPNDPTMAATLAVWLDELHVNGGPAWDLANKIAREAKEAGTPISLTQLPSRRRCEIVRFILAATGEGEARLRDFLCINNILGTIEDDVTLGAVIGALTIDEATRLADLVNQ